MEPPDEKLSQTAGSNAPAPAHAAAPQRRLWLFRLSAAALGLLLAFAAVEIAARLVLAARPNDIETLRRFEHKKREGGPMTLINFVRISDNPRLIFELIPNLEGSFQGVPVKFNSSGRRDPERPVTKPPGVFRIAALGDSVLFGWGAPQEWRFTDLLESFLNETTTGTKFEVLNFGVPGYNTVMEAEMLRARALAWQPDAVLLSFIYDNDAAAPNFISRPRPLFTLSRSCALEALLSEAAARTRADLEAGLQGTDPKNVPDEYQYLIGWDKTRAALKDISDICAARKMPRVFAPDYYNVEKWRGVGAAPLSDNPENEIRDYAVSLGYIDATPVKALIEYLDTHNLHSKALSVGPERADAHPNPLRHAIEAKVICERMAANGALPDAQARAARLPQDLARWDEIIGRARQASNISVKYVK
ncbi:MAG: SGNH/GDSL hydrolase family protein [bacterium]|nr:SGNH/GDSL hydrolase family protein [Candidatus Sumerlaeota bacterium]